MRGFDYIPGGIGLECLLFPTNWFTRAIRARNGRAQSIIQIEAEHQYGRLLWMLPSVNFSENEDNKIIENILAECVRRELLYIIGSIEEKSPYSDLFKKHGFVALGWEQVWQFFPQKNRSVNLAGAWKKTESVQFQQINHLHNELLPPTEKFIGTDLQHHPPEYCLVSGQDVIGYSFTNVNLDQAIVTPYFSPEVNNPEDYIYLLLDTYFSNHSGLYIVQRSHQRLSESSLSENCKNVSNKRRRIVKHLAIRNKDVITEFAHQSNGRKTNIVTPAIK